MWKKVGVKLKEVKMPDFWTHIHAGEEIKNRINEAGIKKIIDDHQKLYNFGCQGPDPFFYNDFWPWKKEKRGPDKAELIHHSSGRKIFRDLLLYYKYHDIIEEGELPNTEHKQKQLVYLLGFAAHFALDSVCHLFVINHCGGESRHKLFEMKLDQYILKERFNKNAAELNPVKEIDFSSGIKEVIEFYQYFYPKISDEDFPEEILRDSYRDFKRFLKLFYDPRKRKYYLFIIINKFFEKDLSNYSYHMAEESSYWDEYLFSNFESLYNIAVNRGKDIFADLLAFLREEINIDEALNNISSVDFLGESSN